MIFLTNVNEKPIEKNEEIVQITENLTEEENDENIHTQNIQKKDLILESSQNKRILMPLNKTNLDLTNLSEKRNESHLSQPINSFV